MGKLKLTKDEIDDYSRRIKHVCYNYGLRREDTEDCINWIFLKWAEGQSRKQTISQSVVDFLRMTFGSTRKTTKNDVWTKKRRGSSTISIDALEEWQKPNQDTDKKERIKSDIYRLCALIPNERVRLILVLSVVWGITQRELSYILCIDEARVSQLKSKGIGYLTNLMKNIDAEIAPHNYNDYLEY